jgi:hypothetical protein
MKPSLDFNYLLICWDLLDILNIPNMFTELALDGLDKEVILLTPALDADDLLEDMLTVFVVVDADILELAVVADAALLLLLFTEVMAPLVL